MILEDLAKEVIPLNTTAREAWDNWYSHMWEVQEEQVLFEQFQPVFNRHKKQISKKMQDSLEDKVAYKKTERFILSKTATPKGRCISTNTQRKSYSNWMLLLEK